MGVVQAESIQGTVSSIDDSLDTSRVYYFKHQSGEVASATILDMDGCAFLGKAALKDRQMMAELYDMGQNILNEKDGQEEIDDEQAVDDIEQDAFEQKAEPNKAPSEHGDYSEKNQRAQTDKTNNQAKDDNSGQEADVLIAVQTASAPSEIESANDRQANQAMPVAKSAPNVLEPIELSDDMVPIKIQQAAIETDTATNKVIETQYAPEQINPDTVDSAESTSNGDRAATGQVRANEAPTDSGGKIFEEIDTHFSEIIEQTIPTAVDEPVELEAEFEGLGSAIAYEYSADLPLNAYRSENNQSFPELDLPIEVVEQAVTLVVEQIATLEDEAADEVQPLLDQIARLAKAANSAPDIVVDDEALDLKPEDIDLELKELFKQLFGKLEIEHTPELVEAFVNLALKGNLTELEKLKQNEVKIVSKDTGTHEILDKMLRGLAQIKTTIEYALVIGRSAMRLYNQNLLSMQFGPSRART